MRFSVDAHAIGCRLTGNEVYVRNLLTAVAAVDEGSDFIAYISTAEAEDCLPAPFLRRRVSRNPFVRLGLDLPRRLQADRPDLIHVQYTAPLFCPAAIVASVHDVSFIEHPEYFTGLRAAQLRVTVRNTVKRAARILTGSEYSRRKIQKVYGIDESRITVVPNAASPLFRPLPHDEAAARTRRRLQIPAPYILNVGDVQARKNQAGLIRAFDELARVYPELPHHLVLAGQDSWHSDAVHREAERSSVSERIHFTGFVSDQELLELYNGCEFFVFPSLYEGFGLPVLEAMACARPVACSSTSAVHEVADASAILFDPQSTAEIVRAMADLALDAELRARMGRLGSQRAAHFSWRRAAERTLEVYYEVTRAASRQRQAQLASASVSK